MKLRLNCVLFCEDGDDIENKTDNDYEESGMEGGSMTRSRNELEEDQSRITSTPMTMSIEKMSTKEAIQPKGIARGGNRIRV